MIILFSLETVVVLILYLLSRKKFKQVIDLSCESDDKLKPLLNIGFQVMAIFKHTYCSEYEKRLEDKLCYIHGAYNAHNCLKIHIARKVVLMLFAVVFLTFVGSQVEIDTSYLIFSLSLLALLFYIIDRQLDDKIRDKKRSMQLEFPEFLNKLILLVNAGLTIPASIQKIIRDNKKNNPLYNELGISVKEINSGKSELQAYEDFAKRCKLQEITTFIATLMQNMRKGNSELIPILRLQTAVCWENRKNIAKKLGEEASTKLLIPMIIIFIAILIMIVTPAIMQLNF